MNTTQDRTAVLRSLADGTISVSEADERLAAIDDAVDLDPPEAPPAERAAFIPPVGRVRGTTRQGRPSVDEVISLAAHGVDAAYIAGLRRAGVTNLTTDEIIRFATHGVEVEWIEAVLASGIEASTDELVSMASHGVEVDWIREIRAAGVQADAADLVRLAVHGVEADWLAAIRATVRDELGVDALISLANHGVEPEDVRAYFGDDEG